MEIKFFGGKDEIGGNKILIEEGKTRILLDFGMSFKTAGKYFSEFLQPRKAVALTDFFEFGLLPDLKGLYREDYLKHMNRPTEKKEIDAVFLSHAHADHAPYIHFLRKDIPIHCTKPTHIILKALEETGASNFADFLTGCETYVFYTNSKGGQSRVTSRNTDYVFNRQFNIMNPYEKINVGSLKVQCVPVDHSLPGACGYIISSEKETIVYTGDIRFHGYNKALSDKFVEIAKSVNPDVLLCEGTRIKETKNVSEEKVLKKITRLVSKAKGLVFVEHPIRDIDRVFTIYRSAKENDKEFVITLKQAYLIRELGELSPFKLTDVKILVPQKSWGLICKDNVDASLVEADYQTWEREFIHLPNAINYKELVKNPSKYVVSMNMWEINQLTDIKPMDAIWIKSSCEPFSDEMEIDEERKENWLKHFKIRHYHAHASGHAPGADIKRLITEINAKKVIPIHTEHKEMF